MRFQKGNQMAKLRKDKEAKKTVWIMESLAQQGYNYEKTLVGFLERAAQGDKLAYDMAALLIKLVPHLANAPKNDVGVNQIETLVINRYDTRRQPESIPGEVVDVVAEGQTPTDTV